RHYEAPALSGCSSRTLGDDPRRLTGNRISVGQHLDFHLGLLELAVSANQVIGRAVMSERRFLFGLQLRDDSLRQCLAQLASQLVKGNEVPDRPLRKDRVFVKSHKFTQRGRREPLGENRIGWPVAFKDTMRYKPIRCAFAFYLVGSLAHSQRLSLSEYV